jgi:transmembrane sensor
VSDPTPPDEFLSRDPLILDRYVAGESDSAERALVERWLASDPSRAEFVALLRRAHEEGAVSGGSKSAAKRWARLADAMRASDEAPRSARVVPLPRVGSAQHVSPYWRDRVGVAAAAAIVVAFGAFGVWGITRVVRAPAFREFASAAGSRATVTLRDGTTLVLGPATHVRVPSDFGGTSRALELDGEAQFTVVHDAAHPFAVHTARAVVRDVGTTFVVRAYTGDAVERVAVQEGKVDLSACHSAVGICTTSAHATPLTTGDVATIGDTVSVKHVTNMAVWTAWVQGGLVFEDAPLGEVVQDIGRAFGVQITVADSALFARHVTAKLTGQPLDLALDAVTQAVGARYERTESGIVIRIGLAGTRSRGAPERQPLTTVRATDPSK